MKRRSSFTAALRSAFGLCASALVFWLILRFIAKSGVSLRVATCEPGWALLAIAALTAQILLVALRWAYFARELGVPLTYSAALGAYYVSMFLNQLLPLGVAGDAVRGVWHARRLASVEVAQRSPRPVLDAASALILDRASGQLVLFALVAAVLPSFWRPVRSALGGSGREIAVIALVGAAIGAAVVLSVALYFRRSALRHTERLRRVFLRPGALVRHGAFSVAALGTHLLAFVCVARALGFALPFGLALRVVPLVLAASTLPSLAFGAGAREAAAAALYHLLGLQAAEGAAIALSLGLLGFVASWPAVLVLLGARFRSSV